MPTAVELSLFHRRLSGVCDEMGAQLRKAAFSTSIRDRLDYSCAVFDARGRLAAQAAHIPVHLGSMAYALRGVIDRRDWRDGHMLVFNAPALGGTHLPDVTLVAPVFVGGGLVGFVANRAHHTDIGAVAPGGMPLSWSIDDEGILIEPQWLARDGETDWDLAQRLVKDARDPALELGDYAAQISSNRLGVARLAALVEGLGPAAYARRIEAVNAAARRFARAELARIPPGEWRCEDRMDGDGRRRDIPIRLCLHVGAGEVVADFAGTAPEVEGNINCPLAVTVSAVYYVFRCLMPAYALSCDGAFEPLEVRAPAGSLVNAGPRAAVAGGNVETSSRIVDCVLGALAKALPERAVAASQGTMNNLALGGDGDGAWSYYETMGGGAGAGDGRPGRAAVQTHMTNTLNTPVEALELRYPLRVARYAVRRGSGGAGRFPGGDGLIREFEFLEPATATLLTERRDFAPPGACGGAPGAPGRNLLNGEPLAGKAALRVKPGDRLRVETPGGGGWGAA